MIECKIDKSSSTFHFSGDLIRNTAEACMIVKGLYMTLYGKSPTIAEAFRKQVLTDEVIFSNDGAISIEVCPNGRA